ncbi:iron ABC transporter permease [Parasphingopyxis sp.]|uniref:ABC transporter permease n=1 Tax=Parasphingopyxis sp. TaxID=1920299 RepID=UPI002636922D|nr:iron ABC transporter permease [Parasphingopyxis sp.]
MAISAYAVIPGRSRFPIRLGFSPTPFAVAAALICVAPIGALLAISFGGASEHLRHLADTQLGLYAWNSAALAVMTAIGTVVLGVPAAWLVARYRFPGRSFFSWGLALPLAMPAYVAAYAWVSMTAAGGPVYAASGGALLTVRGLIGAAFVFSFAYYPYVFLLARQAFETHGTGAADAARTLGAGPFRSFTEVALPLARPAIMAGVALAVMETLADYGAVDFLGAPTFTVGIIRAWGSFGEPAAAAQLALILLFAMMLLFGVERAARRRRSIAERGGRNHPPPRMTLSPAKAWLAFALCLAPLAIGLIVPGGRLVQLAIETEVLRFPADALRGTLILATASGLIAAMLGLGAAYAARTGGVFARGAVRAAHAGYAIPGAVGALGVLALLAFVQSMADVGLGAAAPAIAGGGVLALLFAYQARFAAAAIGPAESALARIPPSLDHAARTLGARPGGVILRVHLPLAFGGIATAALLVFIEVMKELPATMILRPIDFETLAVTAHNYASDERLAQAALPSLLLVAIGLPAMIIVARLVSGVGRSEAAH